jgi:hypothetical protein
MKSAYELAMERFERDNPINSKQLTEAQKKQLRDVEQRFAAKIAEKEIFLKGQIDKARSARDGDAIRQLEAQLTSERERLNEEKEQAKEKVRNA